MRENGAGVFTAMIETIKFVRAALAKADCQPELRCFRLRNRTITASNGALTIQAPIAIDLNACPLGEQFFKAISACKETVSLHLDGGRMIVKSGRFKSAVGCLDETRWPDLIPNGPIFPIASPILPILKKLLPFVSTDETRPWACSVLFTNNSAFATNNVSIVEHWIPVKFPAICNIPIEAIRELVRLNIEPHSIQLEAQRVTFHLPGGAWFSSMLSVRGWPDLTGIFNDMEKFSGEYMEGEILLDFLKDCDRLTPFAESRFPLIHFSAGKVSTMNEQQAETAVESPVAPLRGTFSPSQLASLTGTRKVGWSHYPAPVPFYGEKFRGVLFCFKD